MGRRIVELLRPAATRWRCCTAAPPMTSALGVRNIQANRADLPTVAACSSRTAASTPSSTSRTTGGRGHQPATSRPRRALRRPVAALRVHVEHRRLPAGRGPPRRRAAGAGRLPQPVRAAQGGAERLLFRMHAASGFPAVTFRPPFVHGPRQPFYREQFFWDRLLGGRPIILPDGGDRPMPWAFVDDVADSCVRALEVPAAVGRGVQRRARRADDAADRSWRCSRASRASSRGSSRCRGQTILAAGGELMGKRLYFGEYLDLPPLRSVIEKAPRILGVSPMPLEEALRRSFEWYQAQPRRAVDYAFEDALIAGVPPSGQPG